jgi:hypothetical protein
MLRDFSDLDLVSTGVYGFRPLLEISATCYSKQSIFLHTSASSASMNSEFKNKLDEYSQCKLPEKLKTGICKAIEEHCFNSSLSVNMDITSLASLSSDLKQTFSTLLEHVYSVDSRSMMLVLKVIGLIAENGPAMSEASHQTSEQNTTPESDVRNYSTPHMRGASNSLNNNDICQSPATMVPDGSINHQCTKSRQVKFSSSNPTPTRLHQVLSLQWLTRHQELNNSLGCIGYRFQKHQQALWVLLLNSSYPHQGIPPTYFQELCWANISQGPI